MIFCAGIGFFSLGLRARYFDDEYAYITQSYYADLFFSRQWNHKLWLEPEAADLQPLPKYLIGLAFHCAGLPMPAPVDARNWYFPYLRRSHSRVWGGPETLLAARLTVIPLGALGCLAVFATGSMLKDARLGMIAAGLLMINPLYALQAHRAMADVPYEAFMLSALAVWLFVWARIWSKGFGVCGHRAPVAGGNPGGHVALVQAQRPSGAGRHGGLLRADLAAAGAWGAAQAGGDGRDDRDGCGGAGGCGCVQSVHDGQAAGAG